MTNERLGRTGEVPKDEKRANLVLAAKTGKRVATASSRLVSLALIPLRAACRIYVIKGMVSEHPGVWSGLVKSQ